jgi:hypothetical protein
MTDEPKPFRNLWPDGWVEALAKERDFYRHQATVFAAALVEHGHVEIVDAVLKEQEPEVKIVAEIVAVGQKDGQVQVVMGDTVTKELYFCCLNCQAKIHLIGANCSKCGWDQHGTTRYRDYILQRSHEAGQEHDPENCPACRASESDG